MMNKIVIIIILITRTSNLTVNLVYFTKKLKSTVLPLVSQIVSIIPWAIMIVMQFFVMYNMIDA